MPEIFDQTSYVINLLNMIIIVIIINDVDKTVIVVPESVKPKRLYDKETIVNKTPS